MKVSRPKGQILRSLLLKIEKRKLKVLQFPDDNLVRIDGFV